MIALILSLFLLASGIFVNKIILFAMSPTFLVGIRMTIAGFILFLYTFFHEKHRLTWNQIKSHFGILIAITLTTTLIPAILKAYSYKYMPISKAAFFGTLDPFITAIYAYFLFSERLSSKKIAGIFFGILGTLILLISTTREQLSYIAFLFISYPELAALGAVMVSRFGWILIQKLVKQNIYAPPQINTITMLLGGIISLIIAYFTNDIKIGSLTNLTLPIFQMFPLNHLDSLNAHASLIFLIAYTIIAGNIFGYTLYTYALKRYTSTFISLAGFSIPLIISFLGWLLLNEHLSIGFFLACTVIFAGLWIFFQEEK